jgi:adenine-specific DNA-methyltransferase
VSNKVKAYSNKFTTIYKGDCLNIIENYIADNSIDLVFADPPYNIGKNFGEFKDSWSSDKSYITWCKKWINLCLKKLKPTGSIYIMASSQSMPYLDTWLRKHCTILARIIWHYDSSGVQAKKYYGSMYEPILFGVRNNKNYTFNSDEIKVEAKTGSVRKLIDYRKVVPTTYNTTKVPGNVWYFTRVRYRMPEYEEHPSQKPQALLERIIKASSNEGDLVLDPFGGTFTTCAIAQNLKRKSISMDINSDYVRIGRKRLKVSKCHTKPIQKINQFYW